MSDKPIIECPDCEEHSLRRIISGGTGLIFKGSGYYLTDYKNNNKVNKSDKIDSNSLKKEKKKKTKKEVGSK